MIARRAVLPAAQRLVCMRGRRGDRATLGSETVSKVAVADGELVIEFVPKVQNPEINGIEILQP